MIVGAYISVFLNLKHHLSIVHFKICLVKILFPTIHDGQNVIKERTLFKERKKKTIPQVSSGSNKKYNTYRFGKSKMKR